MQIAQKTNYTCHFTKEELKIVSKALTGVLKKNEAETALQMGIELLSLLETNLQDSLTVAQGSLQRASDLVVGKDDNAVC